MKTIKSILIVATLVSATVVSTMSAQQPAQPAQAHEWGVEIGDSVMIKRECIEYSTGERPSVWVWDKVHTVRQLGTKKHPDGVLLMNIYSWICDSCLTNLTRHSKQQPVDAGKDDQGGQKAEQGGESQVSDGGQQAGDSGQQAGDSTQVGQDDNKGDIPEHKDDTVTSKQQFKHNYDRFTIGLRGGAAGLLHQVQTGKWDCGFDVVLDLQYAHYWANDARPVDLGIIVGLGIGYSRAGMSAVIDDNRQLTDEDGDKIDYKLTADAVREFDGQIQLEVPVMFSLIHDNGLFFNVGPKFMLPVYTPYDQNIVKPNINAYFQKEGVTVTNEAITGYLTDNQLVNKGSDNGNQFSVNIMLTAELGYEWILKSGNSLGLGAFANYCVYNSFKNKASNSSLLDVSVPSSAGIATVDVLSATKTYANKLGYFDVGVKLAYHFNFPKKQKIEYRETEKLY